MGDPVGGVVWSGVGVMAVTSINIEQMSEFVRALRDALGDGPAAVSRIQMSLDEVELSCVGLSRWGYNGAMTWQLAGILGDASRRLDFAIETLMTEKPWVGSWAGQTVWYDDQALTDADAARVTAVVKQWADQANGVDPGDLPQEIVDVMARNQWEPVFASALAARLGPSQVATLVGLVNGERNYLSQACPDEVPHFDDRSARLLDLVGDTLGRAASGMDAERLDFFTGRWADFITAQPQGSPGAQLLSLVVGRGVWPDEFLTGIADAIHSSEDAWMDGAGGWDQSGVRAVDWWGPGVTGPVTDPAVNLEGTHDVISDPMAGVWRAAIHNPGWMLTRYGGGGVAEVMVDTGATRDQTINVSQSVYDMFTVRGLDACSAQWFVQALVGVGRTDPDAGTRFVMDVTGMSGYYTREQRVWEETPQWDKLKHIVLPCLAVVTAFIPYAGPWISTGLMLTDAGYYYYEGDPTAGTVSVLCALVPIGVAGAVTRWSTITFTTSEMKALNAGRAVTIDDTEFRIIDGQITMTPIEQTTVIDSKIWYPSGPDLANHLKTVEGFNRDGIDGGHNLQSFEQAYRDHGVDPEKYIDSTTEIFPGVYELKYKVPRLKPGGITLDENQNDLNVHTKTVYDPAVISDEQMLGWAEQAMIDPHLIPGETVKYEGVAPNGLKFNGYLNDGHWTSIYPVRQ